MNSPNRYRGRTPGDAMKKARAELGDDARLVSARRVSPPDAPPVYEVQVIGGEEAAAPSPGSLDALRREIESLRAALVPVPSAAAAASGAESPRDDTAERLRAQWIDLLRRRGAGAAVAARLADRTLRGGGAGDDEREPLARLHATLAAELHDEGDDPLGSRSTVLVGPGGAGKTSVLAKLATEMVARGESPVLVTTDGDSLTGEDELEAVAAALGLPFRTAFLDGELASLAEDAGSVLLVDTPGRTPSERDGLRGLTALRDALPRAEILPVLPATMDTEEARLLLEGYASVGAERAVLTRLDEMSRPGRLLDLVRALDRPVAWVTFGRAARGAAAAPSSPRVVERILGTVLALETRA